MEKFEVVHSTYSHYELQGTNWSISCQKIPEHKLIIKGEVDLVELLATVQQLRESPLFALTLWTAYLQERAKS